MSNRVVNTRGRFVQFGTENMDTHCGMTGTTFYMLDKALLTRYYSLIPSCLVMVSAAVLEVLGLAFRFLFFFV